MVIEIVFVGVDEGDEEVEELVEHVGLVGVACQIKVERPLLVLQGGPAVDGVDGHHQQDAHNVSLELGLGEVAQVLVDQVEREQRREGRAQARHEPHLLPCVHLFCFSIDLFAASIEVSFIHFLF